ncbi:hypothetical protein CR513_57066, partial [Mucuna pruriens]
MTLEINQNYMFYFSIHEIWENLVETYSMCLDVNPIKGRLEINRALLCLCPQLRTVVLGAAATACRCSRRLLLQLPPAAAAICCRRCRLPPPLLSTAATRRCLPLFVATVLFVGLFPTYSNVQNLGWKYCR